MARYLWCVPILLLVAAGAGDGAPVKGARITARARIGARSHMEFEDTYEGGRRACVIAMGDHRPPVNIGIVVYDEANQRVTEDQGIDYAAVIWYPPRSAKYKVVVSNSGAEYNEMYLVFK